MKALATLLLVFSALGANAAQPVYRCGSAYSDSPCPQASLVDVGDTRSDAQRADAQLLAANDNALAAQMERERLARERVSKPVKPTHAKHAKPAHATKIRWFKP